ncbi:hypothetical protein GCM10011416_05200 [Polaribacter pacificus]|uniref:Uncharacterized protein n=1 Tax=Polaribacter pacificus TaxID=1775173 RepID=A0A917HW31_9FLAO|nr:hypothetical protein [Polaribacter pacificus]GGG91504.1 hypothetical protein GCM10011416_05200 [Polaribacter pacificus]
MHKKLAADLTSIAHSILQLKNKDDIFVLKQKAYQVYEKLALLAYVEEYINTTPNATESKEELIAKIEEAAKEKLITSVIEEESEVVLEENEVTLEIENTNLEVEIEVEEEEQETEIQLEIEETVLEQPFDELEALFDEVPELEVTNLEEEKEDEQKVEEEKVEKKIPTLDEELSDTISIDVAADLFGKPTEVNPSAPQTSPALQIGLNDRIAFVKHLFAGSQEDFNRVISQLNTVKTQKEAKKFVNKMVKPDYDWTDKEEYETRFMEIVERTFND